MESALILSTAAIVAFVVFFSICAKTYVPLMSSEGIFVSTSFTEDNDKNI